MDRETQHRPGGSAKNVPGSRLPCRYCGGDPRGHAHLNDYGLWLSRSTLWWIGIGTVVLLAVVLGAPDVAATILRSVVKV